MKRVVGIRQKYDNYIKFIETEHNYMEGDAIVVQDEYASFIYIVQSPKIKFNKAVDSIWHIVSEKRADLKDLAEYQNLQKESRQYKKIFIDIVNKRKLPINVIAVLISLDGKTIKIIFSSDFKIRYNELIQEFLYITKKKYKVELYQLNNRDYNLRNGGAGVCGFELCCHKLGYIKPLIKENDISLLTNFYGFKSSLIGICKQYKCCLLFDLDDYKYYAGILPRVGEAIIYEGRKVVVRNYNFQTMEVYYKYKQRMKKTNIKSFLEELNIKEDK